MYLGREHKAGNVVGCLFVNQLGATVCTLKFVVLEQVGTKRNEVFLAFLYLLFKTHVELASLFGVFHLQADYLVGQCLIFGVERRALVVTSLGLCAVHAHGENGRQCCCAEKILFHIVCYVLCCEYVFALCWIV